MFREVPNYWETDAYKKNADMNINSVENTINDLKFNERKIMVCGRGEAAHPDFFPRFATPTTDIDSNLYVTVDHSPAYTRFITRKGDYALCLIVHPNVAEKIRSMGGKIYWFSPEYFNYDIPQITFARNSGLAAVALALHFNVKFILLSGINLTGQYSQFIKGAKIIFEQAKQNGTQIFSLNGILAKQITYEEWCKL